MENFEGIQFISYRSYESCADERSAGGGGKSSPPPSYDRLQYDIETFTIDMDARRGGGKCRPSPSTGKSKKIGCLFALSLCGGLFMLCFSFNGGGGLPCGCLFVTFFSMWGLLS